MLVTYWHYNYLKNTKQSNGQVGETLERSSNPRETMVVVMGNDYLKKSAKVKALLAYLTISDRKQNLKQHFFYVRLSYIETLLVIKQWKLE